MSVPSPTAWHRYRRLDRRIWVLAGVRAVNTMGLSLAMAFMAIYLVKMRGETAETYGLIFLAANLCQSFAQGWAGELSDWWGRRRVMTSALWVRSVVIGTLGVEILWAAPVWMIAMTLVVSSCLRGCFEPVAYAFVADVAEPEERVTAYGLQRMGTNLGWAIGPAAGGLLAQVVHYGLVFFFAAAALIMAGAATARLRDPARLHTGARSSIEIGFVDAMRQAVRQPAFAVLIGCSFLFAVAHVQLFTTLSIYGSAELGLSNAQIGLVYTVNGVAVLLLQIPAVALIDRIGNVRSAVFGSLLLAGSWLLVGAATGTLTLAAAIAVLTIGEVIVAPAHQAAGAELGDPKRMGRVFGLLGTATMLGVAFGPLFGGVLFDHIRHRPMLMWGIIASVCLLLVVGYLIFGARRTRQLTGLGVREQRGRVQ